MTDYQYIPGKPQPLLCGWSLPNYACEMVGDVLLRVIVGWTHCGRGELALFAIRWQTGIAGAY